MRWAGEWFLEQNKFHKYTLWSHPTIIILSDNIGQLIENSSIFRIRFYFAEGWVFHSSPLSVLMQWFLLYETSTRLEFCQGAYEVATPLVLNHSLRYPPPLLAFYLFSLSVPVKAHCLHQHFAQTLYYYSKGMKLFFCLSKMVNTWVLTSGFLYSNCKVACCAQDSSASLEPNWTQHFPATCREQQRAETEGELRHPTGIFARVWFLSFRHVPFKGSSSNCKSSLHSSTCLDSEDSTWHKETHSLITFYSFLSTTVSLIPCMWWAYLKSPDYIPRVHILESLCPFSLLSLRRDFLWNLGQLYSLILCNGLYLISFTFYSIL